MAFDAVALQQRLTILTGLPPETPLRQLTAGVTRTLTDQRGRIDRLEQDVQVAELRKIYKAYQQTQSIQELIAAIEAMRSAYGVERRPQGGKTEAQLPKLNRDDLRLICRCAFGRVTLRLDVSFCFADGALCCSSRPKSCETVEKPAESGAVWGVEGSSREFAFACLAPCQ